MPATLPPPSSTTLNGIPEYQTTLPNPPVQLDTSQVKVCCQCLSPLSPDSQMTFHVALAPVNGRGVEGETQQGQICARCVIAGGILGVPAEDDTLADNTDYDREPDRDGRLLYPSTQPDYFGPGARGTDDGGQRYGRTTTPLKPLTPPLSPSPQTRSAAVIDISEVNLSRRPSIHDGDRLLPGRNPVSVTPSPPPLPRPSSSLPADFYHPSQSAGSLDRSDLPPRTPSPEAFLPTPVSPVVSSEPTEDEVVERGPPVLPDLYADISSLRRKSESRGCLYPGSIFKGTQKSGRNAYEVTVTIIDVSFTEATLTGYLLIHNLTSSHPQLTTLFTADLIGGPVHGFYTGAWGATEEDDITHWSRFRGFSSVRKEMRGAQGTVPSRERNCVFMRWKERFLVPDHRIRDINGASFAGFYYVCVEFDPSARSESPTPSQPFSAATRNPLTSQVLPPPPPRNRARSASLMDAKSYELDKARERAEKLEKGAESGYGTATMEGLYFHQNSEPYQHLSLRHVVERTSSTFEFR